MNAIEMRGESSADGSVGEVSLHHTEFALGIAFSSVKFNLLVLYHLEFTLMCLIPIDISNNTRVLEVYDGIANEKSRGGRRVKNVEVVIFDPRAIEIWSGMCLHMKGNGILGVSWLADPYDVSVNSNLPEGNISWYFILTILIEKDKRVLPYITAVILTPSNSWVIWVVKLLSELGNVGDGIRHGGEGNGGIILSESNWFIALYIII